MRRVRTILTNELTSFLPERCSRVETISLGRVDLRKFVLRSINVITLTHTSLVVSAQLDLRWATSQDLSSSILFSYTRHRAFFAEWNPY
jgi:hypothetical protein